MSERRIQNAADQAAKAVALSSRLADAICLLIIHGIISDAERDELSRDLEEVRRRLTGYKDQHRRDREYIGRLQREVGISKGEALR